MASMISRIFSQTFFFSSSMGFRKTTASSTTANSSVRMNRIQESIFSKVRPPFEGLVRIAAPGKAAAVSSGADCQQTTETV